MMTYLPGTTVEINTAASAETFLDSLFAANGLVLSQVLQLTGLSAHTVQNWVKRKFVPPPVNKKYNRDQFCTIVMINMLNETFRIDQITGMIEFVRRVSPDAPSLIYGCFVGLLGLIPPDTIRAATDTGDLIDHLLSRRDLDPSVYARLKPVLQVMVLAYISSRVRSEALQFLSEIDL